MRPRRSMLFIPGANAAMLSTSFVYGADAVIFDLEDAVALREKDTARLLVHHALQHPFYQDVEKVVRINPLNTPFGLADLEAVVRGGGYCASAENRQQKRCAGAGSAGRTDRT